MNRKAMYERIEKHGRALLAIFPDATERDPVKLCKKLRRIEAKASAAAVDFCNGVMDEADWTRAQEAALFRLIDLLVPTDGELIAALFVNGDPRGYALKIDDGYVKAHNLDIHRDWGGYGIIAPDLSEGGE